MADNEALDDVPRQRLGDLIGQYGPELCKDPAHFEALLRDLCGEHRREVFVLASALKAGLVTDIQKALEGGARGQLLTSIVQRMHETLTISEDVCRWAVESWALALRGGGSAASSAAKGDAAPAEPVVPPPSAEHRRIATAQFDRANQVIAGGNYDYGIQLLLTCCKLDPANVVYRQALRRTEKAKFKNNLHGSKMALLTTGPARARIKALKRSGDYLKVLEHGEEVLAKNPWDTGVQLDMAEAADALGLTELGIWILLQARQKDPNDPSVNRFLARLYEKRGNFSQAISLWELVRQADPKDVEARSKAKDLAASQTIIRGQFEEAVNSDGPRQVGDKKKPAAETKKMPLPPVEARLARETEALRKRLAGDPTNPSLYLQLAGVYRRAGVLDQAQTVLREGLAASGKDFQMTLELTELELDPLRQDLAIAEEKLRAAPQDEELRKIRIGLLKEINARELELFRQKADRYPNELAHHLELGVRLLRAGQIDEAIRALQTVRGDGRLQWRALLYLGYCFKARNNWRLAQRNFEEALKVLPAGDENTRKEVLFQLANGHAEAGDLATALDLGHELANLDFAYRDIGRLLDEWQTRLQQA